MRVFSYTPKDLSSESLLGFLVQLARQKEEDQAGDQDPGELARRDQHHPTGGHSQRPSGRTATCPVKMSGRVLD